MVVILASLLCALVCVLGLALVSRCACRRRRSASSSSDHSPPPKGLKKKAIDALPTISFAISPESSSSPASTVWSSASECAIYLAEFADGDSVRVLPQCGHGLHVVCVDAWLRTHDTCPSCRSPIVVATESSRPALETPTVVVVVAAGGGSRCGRCGELAAPAGACSGGGNAVFLP
jgi:hypothetical protein